jgi:four helix bundle protein
MVEERSMKSSKFQVPSSNETSSSKAQRARIVNYLQPSPGSVGEILEGDDDSMAQELRDGPLASPDGKPPYDLEERTALFGEAVVRFSQKVPRDPGNDRLIGQLVGCGTSVGANYAEASETVSKKDFRYAISRCVKEAKETRHFLRMVVAAQPELAEDARKLYREARELHLIFASMYRK